MRKARPGDEKAKQVGHAPCDAAQIPEDLEAGYGAAFGDKFVVHGP
jgi:hypothetical protein